MVIWSLYVVFNSLRVASHLKGLYIYTISADKVHYSQAYRNMEMTRKRISFAFDPKDMFLSLHIGFSFVRAAVAFTIIERTSGFEQSSTAIAPMYLKFVTIFNFCFFTLVTLLPFSSLLQHSEDYGWHWRCLSSIWSSQH